jgi:hypothetical protein
MSSFPVGATIYTFAGVSFIRQRDGDTMQPWAFAETQYTKDAILGGGSYLDIGGDVAPPLSFRARVLTTADRSALKMARGTTAVLSNTRGRSDTMTLIKATPVDGLANQLDIDLTFELR